MVADHPPYPVSRRFPCRFPPTAPIRIAPITLIPHPTGFTTSAPIPRSPHGEVPRFRCTSCGRTLSAQTESIHYYAKRRLPLKEIHASLVAGASQRDVARRYRCSPMAIQNAVLRLGRQSMGYQAILAAHLNSRSRVVIDGLRSFVTSQDYPCDLTTTVDTEGETILTITHAVFRRGGRMTAFQRRRIKRKDDRWRPPPGEVKGAILLTCRELWNYLRPEFARNAVIDTDENPLYRSVLRRDPAMLHFRRGRLVRHRRTAGSAPRTMDNPLFPVNYVDRLLRHRLKEHTRETIAFGRHATLQMSRAWIFAWDHNSRREYRVRRPEEGVHLGTRECDRRGVPGDRADQPGVLLTAGRPGAGDRSGKSLPGVAERTHHATGEVADRSDGDLRADPGLCQTGSRPEFNNLVDTSEEQRKKRVCKDKPHNHHEAREKIGGLDRLELKQVETDHDDHRSSHTRNLTDHEFAHERRENPRQKGECA
jgi:transposase-like protein